MSEPVTAAASEVATELTETAEQVDVIVIGAGVIGAAIALELRRGGVDCLVVDAHIPGRAVSEISFAWVNASTDKTPRSYRELNLMGLEAHHRQHDAGEAPWFHPTGALEVETGGHLGAGSVYEGGAADAKYDDLDGRAPAVSLTAADLADRELSAEITGGTLFPREGWVDVGHQVHASLAALPAGRVLAPLAATAVTTSTDGPSVTLADGRVLRARQVVIANGNGAPALIDGLCPGLSLLEDGAESEHVGLSIETFPLENLPTSVLRSHGVSLRPTRDGGAVIADHATAASFSLSDPELLDLPATLLARAQALVPQLGEIRARSVRIGPRVWPRDGRTVCGWLTEGVYVVLTHSGVTLAPYLAQCVHQELRGTDVPELVDFRPYRFQKG
ncbi:NAD(P)/FAD-dependent oxidoreductase [Brachybacterium sp. AOP29-B2-41]|uniref:NAD(P)/FAD-dependent oxidoreductase n=1 Tax=Brachybacterium sp. AOP29-B2-41 TaxID=3457704 RepID=UPI004033E022